jgi:hypothetical protein
VLGEEEVVVLDVKPVDLHGVIYRDVTVTFPDRSVGQARLGPEGVPADLRPGDVVLATKVVNMIVSLRRP